MCPVMIKERISVSYIWEMSKKTIWKDGPGEQP